MAVIVEHKKTKKRFVLLGIGYGAYKSSRPGFFGGNLFPDEEEGHIKVVGICDKEGNIGWASPKMLRVIEVDGMKLNQLSILSEDKEDRYREQVDSLTTCPGCSGEVSIYDKECPHCGLKLIDSDYEKMSNMAKHKR